MSRAGCAGGSARTMRIDEATNLTTRQEQAIAAMLTEQTMAKAAEAAGVNVRTLNH